MEETLMNELYLKNYNGNEMVYEYQPEGKGDKGIIAYSFAKKAASIQKVAVGDSSQYYARMAADAVTQIADKNNIPRVYTQAWY